MANLIGVKQGTAIVWANSGDYSQTITGLARTKQLDLTSVAAGEARQGAKADIASIATTLNARCYLILIGIEFVSATTIVNGETVDLYWAGSPSATAGNANPGGTSGADADYIGTAGGLLDGSLLALQPIGSLAVTNDDDPVVQYQSFITKLPHRYGMPVVVDNSAAGVLNSNAVEMLVACIPLEDEIQ